MSTTFKKFRKDNIVRTKYTAHKQYNINIENFSGSHEGFEDFQVYGYESTHVNAFLLDSETGRFLRHDEFLTGSFAGITYTELQTTNGLFKRSVHNSLAHLYYNGSHAINVNLDKSFCVEPTRNEYRELNGSAQVISVPQQLFGDKLKENDINFDKDNPSLRILSGTVEIREDGFGNLYDYNAAGLTDALKTYHSTTGSLVGYWGFNELYPYHQDGIDGHCPSFFVNVKDGSRYQTLTDGSTIFIHSQSVHGAGAMFTGQRGNIYDSSKFSFFRAKKHQNIDFRKDEDFAISMWAHLPPSQSDTTGLFNYIVTSGEGFHEDSTIESGFQKSKFPFDIVMYNQTAGIKERATLTFRQRRYEDSAAKQLFRFREKAIMTQSAATASIQFALNGFHAQVTSGQSASFMFGEDPSQLLKLIITASDWSGFPGGVSGPNTSDKIYVPKQSTATQTTTLVAQHINNASSRSAFPNQLAMIEAEQLGNITLNLRYSGELVFSDQLTKGTDFDSNAGAEFVFVKNENDSSIRHRFGNITNGDGISVTQLVASPNMLRQPSESAQFQIKDPLGTVVQFSITSASTATYPTFSVHGAITSSAVNFGRAISNAINASMETGVTSSVGTHANPRILRVSSSFLPPRTQSSTFSGEIVITSSIAGDFSQFGVASIGPGHDNMQTIGNAANVFNNYAFANTPETDDTSNFDGFGQGGSPYPDFFTGSFFILSCRPTESYAPSENIDPDPLHHEKHVFYWKSGSSTAPDLGTFETHSTTEIDLGAAYFFPGTEAHISGAYDYYNVASRSFNAIDAHPSFSVNIEVQVVQGNEGAVTNNLFLNKEDYFEGWQSSDIANLAITGSSGNVVVGPVFPRLQVGDDSSPLSNILLQVTAVNHGITPVVISGSQSGPLFSSSAAVTAIPSSTASMIAGDGNIGRPGQILARRHDGTNLYQLSSSVLFLDNQQDHHHILFQKTGSNLELYMNNNLQQTLKAPDQTDPKNKNDLYFGVATRMTWSGEFERTRDGQYRINPGTGNPVRKMVREFMRPISGALDEIRLFDKALNTEQRQLMYNCPNGSPFVGNVMHEHGILTITHPSGAYANIANNCTASFKNTYVIHENSYTAEIKRGEFNFTMNPSILDQTAEGKRESKIASFITDTDWDPYITTIGLYDDSARLLAVGKLSRPLRKDDGYDTTIEVRFDT